MFDQEICRHEHHPAECVEAVNTWWPVIAKLIYNEEAARKVCAALSEEGVQAIVLFLEGEAFCKSEELGLDEHELHMCYHNIKHFMPQALHLVDRAMHANA